MWPDNFLFSVLQPLQRCLEETISYTRERKAFGRSILDNQTVHFRLAELETELELLRSLLYRTISESVVSCDVIMMSL